MDKVIKKAMLPLAVLPMLLHPLSISADTPEKSEPPTDIRYQVADAHMHYVDFLQNSEGTETLLRMMKRVGVDHAMINGLAVMK